MEEDAPRLVDTEMANGVIGANLRALRAKRKYSRKKLHEVTGIPVITIRRIEDGVRDAPAPVLLALCVGLGVNVAEFWEHIQRELKQAGGINARMEGDDSNLG